MPQQGVGGGAKRQELACALAVAAAVVDLPPQDLEQSRCSLHLVEHHQPACLSGEVASRIGQAGAVGGVLQVDVEAVRHVASDLLGKCGLSYLARAEQHHGWCLGKAAENAAFGITLYHPC